MKNNCDDEHTKTPPSQDDICLYDKDSSSILLLIHKCMDTDAGGGREQVG
jgi:hypothetical protein